MDVRSRANEVQNALQRAKQKMSRLQHELSEKESCSETEEELRLVAQGRSRDRTQSLVDMYQDNPKVNEELKQRLPSPIKYHCLETTAQFRFPESKAGFDASPNLPDSAALLADLSKEPRISQCPGPTEEPALRPRPHCDTELGASTEMMEEEEGCCQSEAWEKAVEELDAPPRHLVLQGCAEPAAPSVDNTKASSSFNSTKPVPVLDKEKNIAFLLKELDSLRDLNKKLQDKLALKEKELETRLVDAQLKETQQEARACQKAGALVEEIYKAQRERDQALMARLRLANEERDEALLRAKRLQQTAAELENISPEEYDTDLEELLNRINSADSALGIERCGAVIVDRLQKARDRRKKITAEEMNAVIEERDAALARCKRLEQDLYQAMELRQTGANNPRHLTAQNNQGRAWKDELETLQQERDRAADRCRKLEDEVRALRSNSSLHQPPEAGLPEQFDPQTSCPREGSVSTVVPQSKHLLAQLQLLASEHHSTRSQLQLAKEAEMEANEKVQKLERLVEVLRKKVGTGSVRTMI